jgi:prolyl-tRNA editing enzyme YbaK/EbsC (Cys-tRNA(Pro) deacylase)
VDAIEQRVVDHLDRLHADYTILPCDPADADTANFCARYGVSLAESANAILVGTRRPPPIYGLTLNLATTRLDVNHTVRHELGAGKMSFVSPEVTRDLTGMEIGGVTPFGIPEDLPVLVDSAVIALGRCVVGGGSRAMKVSLDPEVFTRMPGVRVIAGLAS